MKIRCGLVYQMTGDFNGLEKYEAVTVVAIRRDWEKLKFRVVSSEEEHTASIDSFKKNFTNVDDF